MADADFEIMKGERVEDALDNVGGVDEEQEQRKS